MLDDNELLFDELYEKTKDCGRVQFINLLMEKERENQELKEQLDYLRSGEYLNQLRFERDMLQHVVDTNGVPSEVYDYLECTHRNTELLEENQELKEQLEEIKNEPLTNRIGRIDSVIANIYSRNRTHKKKFIEYLENEIKNSDICDVYVRGMKFNSAEKMIYKDILSKYKEIIGVKDE